MGRVSPVGPTTALRPWPHFRVCPIRIQSHPIPIYECEGRTKTQQAAEKKMGRYVLSHFLSLSTNPPRFSAPLSETLTLLPPFLFPLLLKKSSFFPLLSNRSCSHIRTSYFKKKRTRGIPSLQSPVHLPAGFRCLCTTSAPQTHSSDGPPSAVK